MINVLVTGSEGQLGKCLKDIAAGLDGFKFIYVDVDDLDITQVEKVSAFLDKNKINFCINCAAYTAVDKAETDSKTAESVNFHGATNLAKACKEYNVNLIQISTDFVFNGKKSSPYLENDSTDPLGVYGKTKLKGELAVMKSLPNSFIIRTSWLYSEHGNNFLKTMLRLGYERNNLSVVCDQIGTPTYAGDLAKVILKIIIEKRTEYGLYHFSNEGVASWYDFAKAIFDESNIKVKLLPINSEEYPTPAKRPSFSVMDKTKIKEKMDMEIPYWRDSLKDCLSKMKI